MSADAYKSRTISPSRFSALSGFFKVLTWPFRWPFEFLQSRRDNRAFQSSVDAAWAYCESEWDGSFVDVWCQLIHAPYRPYPPRSTSLLSQFAQAFPDCTDFLTSKARADNPIIAAYAVMCFADPNNLPIDVHERQEVITLRDWFHEVRMTFGDWVNSTIEEFNRFNDPDDESMLPVQTNAR